MAQQITLHSESQAAPLNAIPPLSLDRFMEQSGIAPATCWRWRRAGWLRTIVISGRHYVTREEIAEFNRRAAAGEFAITKPANPYALRKPAAQTSGEPE